MTHYYFDIETTGLNPLKDSIISIQIVPLSRNAGTPCGPLRIYKAWELGEARTIQKFIEYVDLYNEYPFQFVPVGYNLQFDSRFLKMRMAVHNIKPLPFDIVSFERPKIDLRSIGVLIKNGDFKGSSLDAISGKQYTGKKILEWNETKDYEKIEEYIQQEAEEFITFLQWLYKILPEQHAIFMKKLKEEEENENKKRLDESETVRME